MKLSSVGVGLKVMVDALPHSTLRVKLLEMGVVEGRELRIMYKAPFGDPIAVDISGYMLALRLDEADQIEVHQLN